MFTRQEVFWKENEIRGEGFCVPFKLIKMNRKTLSMRFEEQPLDEETVPFLLVVKVPNRTSKREVEQFVSRSMNWIREGFIQYCERQKERVTYTKEEEHFYRMQAKKVITEKVDGLCQAMNLSYGRITIKQQKTRWGSCSAKGNLNFNWKLMLMPEFALDYVVIHEVAHLVHLNHSKDFWELVQRLYPEYRQVMKWFRDNGKKYI